MRYLLFPVAVSFVSGIIFARFLPVALGLLLFLAFFSLFFTFLCFIRGLGWHFFSFILIFFFIAGSLIYSLSLTLPENHLVVLVGEGRIDKREPYEFTAVVVDEPESSFGRVYLKVQLEKLWIKGTPFPVSGRGRMIIRFSRWSHDKAREFSYGDILRTTARFYLPRGKTNKFSFDYREYLHSQGLYFNCYIKSPFAVELVEKGKGNPLLSLSLRFRRLFADATERYFSNERGYITPEGALIKAMTIGEREMLSYRLENMMRQLGIYHLLAISGLHIGIIAYFLYFIFFSCFRLSDRSSSLLVLLIIFFYVLLLPTRPSILRASLMAGIYLLGRIIGRESTLLGSLSLSAIIILLFDPASLFTLGFELSFLATLAIALIAPRIIPYLRFFPRRIAEITAISLAAQIGVLPLLLYHFNIFPPLSFPATLVSFPLVGGIIFGGGIFYLASIIDGGLSLVIAVLLSAIASFFLKVVSFFSSLNITFYLPTPFWWVILGYYLSLILLISRLKRRVFLVLFVVFFLLLITYPFPSRSSPNLSIVFLDVGKGESILIRLPGRKIMLIDSGGEEGDNGATGEHTIAPYLFHLGVRKIDYLVASHFHVDHINGFFPLIREFKVGEFFLGNAPREIGNYRRLIKLVSGKDIPVNRLQRGDEFDISGVRFEVLNPSPDPYVTLVEENDDSLVIKLTLGRVNVLLPADIGGDRERELVDIYGDRLRAEVLKSAHHGGEGSNTEIFLKAVSPKAVVVTGWIKTRGRGLSPVVRQRFKELPAFFVETGEFGAVEVEIDGEGFQIKPYLFKFF